MAIELNKRTKILAGVVVLAAVGAGAWFLFLEEFLSEPPPAPKAVAAKTAPAGAPKQTAAAKPAADAPNQVDAAKPSAAAAAPGAKPIPTNPAKLLAEVIAISGVQDYFQIIGREVMVAAAAGMDSRKQDVSPADYRAMADIANGVFEPAKMAAEITVNLKGGQIDDERLARFLELLRQPIVRKLTAPEARSITPEAMKEYTDSLRKNPPAAARVNLIRTLDDVSRTTDVGADLTGALARDMVDTMLESLKKAGKNAPKDAPQMVGAQLNVMRDQSRSQILAVMYVMYRKATDEELSEYVKLLDTDTGRWGSELLANAMRPAVVARGSALGREVAQVALARMAPAKESVARQPAAQQAEKSSEQPAAAPVAAALEAPGYQRPASIRDAYSRYNDLITATVMRDRAAVKELLDIGKSPNVKQSNGFTPLMVAVSNGDTEIAVMLLARGADPNPRVAGLSALSIARSQGSAGAGMVGLLERSGAKN